MADSYSPERATLRTARFKQSTIGGIATIKIKVPGAALQPGARIIDGGQAIWEISSHPDDWAEIYVMDDDGVVPESARPPSWPVVGTYTDVDVPPENQGWYFLDNKLSISSLGGMGRLMGQLYITILCHTGDGRQDTIRGNITWGAQE